MLPGMQLSNQKVNCAQSGDVRVRLSLQITSYSSLQSPETVAPLVLTSVWAMMPLSRLLLDQLVVQCVPNISPAFA